MPATADVAKALLVHGVAVELAASIAAGAGGTVLDLGAGEGSAIDPGSSVRVRDAGTARLLEVDFFRAHAFPPPARTSVLRLRGDATALPLADGCIDLVVCMHVLEHLGDAARALAEIARVLSPRGRAVVAVPDGGTLSDFAFRAFYRCTHRRTDADFDPHRQCLRAAGWERLIDRAGLRVLQRVGVGESFSWLHKHRWLRAALTAAFRVGRGVAPHRFAYGFWYALAHR